MSAALPATAQETAVLTGTVVDAEQGTLLPGANVAVRTEAQAAVAGASTGADGAFRIGDLEAGAYVVEVRFVGYDARTLPLTLAAGETRTLDVELSPATQSLETIVVSASRRQEKILDAPASISVLQPEEMQREVNTSSIEALRATPGVDMAQTGIDRREVVLRGFNEAFNGSTYVLTDYREAAVPSLGVNLHAIMPNMSTDIERVEVVRGPGSALYGPGVDSGVIHYFTKGPFQHPGTTVSVAGGSRQRRHLYRQPRLEGNRPVCPRRRMGAGPERRPRRPRDSPLSDL
jgi:iron complex outermembrane receptor protein